MGQKITLLWEAKSKVTLSLNVSPCVDCFIVDSLNDWLFEKNYPLTNPRRAASQIVKRDVTLSENMKFNDYIPKQTGSILEGKVNLINQH